MKGARQYPRANLRIPPDLKQYLQAQAMSEGRSFNSEVVRRLQQTRVHDQANEARQ